VTAVELRSVTKLDGQAEALSDLSLTIRSGEFATVLGPSRSGKTTVLSILAGTVGPSAGQIVVGGRDITALPVASRTIGIMFQSYALFQHLTVGS
jgi:ABC-type Fe3+/spermidine/putrescine transport system ATPase subunit